MEMFEGTEMEREFGWKSLIWYFITPAQKSHYGNNLSVCWRKCGNQNANHYHIFWDCSILRATGEKYILPYKIF